jgi:hypothetical protein
MGLAIYSTYRLAFGVLGRVGGTTAGWKWPNSEAILSIPIHRLHVLSLTRAPVAKTVFKKIYTSGSLGLGDI